MRYNSEKGCYEWGVAGIKNFVASHLTGSAWNETQLQLLTETILNHVDMLLEIYKNYPGNIIYIFQALLKISRERTSTHQEFSQFHSKMFDTEQHPWRDGKNFVYEAAKVLSILIRFSKRKLYELRLEKLHSPFWTTSTQEDEAQTILQEIFNVVIKTITISLKDYSPNGLFYYYPPISEQAKSAIIEQYAVQNLESKNDVKMHSTYQDISHTYSQQHPTRQTVIVNLNAKFREFNILKLTIFYEDSRFSLEIVMNLPDGVERVRGVMYALIRAHEIDEDAGQLHITIECDNENNTVRFLGNINNVLRIFSEYDLIEEKELEKILDNGDVKIILQACDQAYGGDEKMKDRVTLFQPETKQREIKRLADSIPSSPAVSLQPETVNNFDH